MRHYQCKQHRLNEARVIHDGDNQNPNQRADIYSFSFSWQSFTIIFGRYFLTAISRNAAMEEKDKERERERIFSREPFIMHKAREVNEESKTKSNKKKENKTKTQRNETKRNEKGRRTRTRRRRRRRRRRRSRRRGGRRKKT